MAIAILIKTMQYLLSHTSILQIDSHKDMETYVRDTRTMLFEMIEKRRNNQKGLADVIILRS